MLHDPQGKDGPERTVFVRQLPDVPAAYLERRPPRLEPVDNRDVVVDPGDVEAPLPQVDHPCPEPAPRLQDGRILRQIVLEIPREGTARAHRHLFLDPACAPHVGPLSFRIPYRKYLFHAVSPDSPIPPPSPVSILERHLPRAHGKTSEQVAELPCPDFPVATNPHALPENTREADKRREADRGKHLSILVESPVVLLQKDGVLWPVRQKTTWPVLSISSRR